MTRHLDYEHAASRARLAAAFREIQDAARDWQEPFEIDDPKTDPATLGLEGWPLDLPFATTDDEVRAEIREFEARYGPYAPDVTVDRDGWAAMQRNRWTETEL